jgi:hypothetical protein
MKTIEQRERENLRKQAKRRGWKLGTPHDVGGYTLTGKTGERTFQNLDQVRNVLQAQPFA